MGAWIPPVVIRAIDVSGISEVGKERLIRFEGSFANRAPPLLLHCAKDDEFGLTAVFLPIWKAANTNTVSLNGYNEG